MRAVDEETACQWSVFALINYINTVRQLFWLWSALRARQKFLHKHTRQSVLVPSCSFSPNGAAQRLIHSHRGKWESPVRSDGSSPLIGIPPSFHSAPPLPFPHSSHPLLFLLLAHTNSCVHMHRWPSVEYGNWHLLQYPISSPHPVSDMLMQPTQFFPSTSSPPLAFPRLPLLSVDIPEPAKRSRWGRGGGGWRGWKDERGASDKTR